MALTKADFAEQLLDELGLNKREAKDMVELFFDEIKGTLEQGEPVKISGFGKFGLRDKGNRPGRNPKTGEEVLVTARRVVTFSAGQKPKALVVGVNGVRQRFLHFRAIVNCRSFFPCSKKRTLFWYIAKYCYRKCN